MRGEGGGGGGRRERRARAVALSARPASPGGWLQLRNARSPRTGRCSPWLLCEEVDKVVYLSSKFSNLKKNGGEGGGKGSLCHWDRWARRIY